MTLQIIIGVMIIMFIANFIKAAVGFGAALIAMPLLTLLIGVKLAAPLFSLVGMGSSLIIVMNNRQSIDSWAALRLVLSALFGVPIGLYLLINVPEEIVLTILGAFLIVYGLYNLFTPPPLSVLQNDNLAYPMGFLGGILGGAYNTFGPPVIAYAALKQWKPDHFRATLQTYMLFLTIVVAIGHNRAGLWVEDVFVYLLFSIPSILLAIYLGDRFHHMIPHETFLRIIYVFLVAMGLVLVL